MIALGAKAGQMETKKEPIDGCGHVTGQEARKEEGLLLSVGKGLGPNLLPHFGFPVGTGEEANLIPTRSPANSVSGPPATIPKAEDVARRLYRIPESPSASLRHIWRLSSWLKVKCRPLFIVSPSSKEHQNGREEHVRSGQKNPPAHFSEENGRSALEQRPRAEPLRVFFMRLAPAELTVPESK